MSGFEEDFIKSTFFVVVVEDIDFFYREGFYDLKIEFKSLMSK
jgi:hypothetical protein